MRVITTPSCEVKPNSGEPQACMMPYNCGYCAGEIKKGEWISKGRAIGDTSWYTIHTSHTADVDQLQGVGRYVGYLHRAHSRVGHGCAGVSVSTLVAKSLYDDGSCVGRHRQHHRNPAEM